MLFEEISPPTISLLFSTKKIIKVENNGNSTMSRIDKIFDF